MQQWSVPWWLGVGVLAVALVTVAVAATVLVGLRRVRRDTLRELEVTRIEVSELRASIDEIGSRPSTPAAPATSEHREYLITGLGDGPDDGLAAGTAQQTPPVPAPLFADLVVRESVVQAASLAAGLRRALSPESRNRIRFEMKREVKRSRKQRRTDLRQARREWEARQRADGGSGQPATGAEGSAA